MKTVLFEDPAGLLWLLAVVEVAALAWLVKRRTRRAAIFATVPILAGVAVALLAATVVTERERLEAALDALVAAAAAADAPGVDVWIDRTYRDGVFTKETLASSAAMAATAAKVRRVRLYDVEMSLDGGQADVALRAMVHLSDPIYGRDVIPTRWRLWWVRRPDRWMLGSAELTEPDRSRAPQGRTPP